MQFDYLTRRLAVLVTLITLALPAAAQQYPSKPIKIILGFGPGGTTDAIVRLYGQKLAEVLNTPVIIDNKPGANQLTAIRAIMASSPDGYTLYAATGSSLVQNPAFRKDLPYDPLKDFTPLGVLVHLHGVVFINNDLPVNSLKELVAYAAANPGKLNYGSAGIGTTGHLAAEAMLAATGMKMAHIPYKADGDVIREVMAGTVHVGIMTTLNTVSPIKAGKIRGILATTSTRLPYLQDVPSMAEAGMGGLDSLQPHSFTTLVGPAGMPQAIVDRLNEAINKVSMMPEVAAKVREGYFSEPVTSTPASFRTFVEKQLATWRDVGKTVKLPE